MGGLVGPDHRLRRRRLRELRRAVLVLGDRPEQHPHAADDARGTTSSAPTRSAATTSAACIYGIRTSEEVGLFVAVVSSIIGLVVGALAGYYGGWIDNLLMRITDLVLTLPLLAILLTAAALLGQGSQWRVSFILALFFWTGIARVVRGVFLSLREKEYVEAAKAAGAGDAADHVPAHPSEHARADHRQRRRSRSPPRSSPRRRSRSSASGSSRRRRRSACSSPSGQTNPQQWWLTIFPGLTIVLIVLCVNFVGDGLRDALDPTAAEECRA